MDLVTLIVGGVIGLLVLETVAITLLVVGDRR
jgi:hypothetical protein